MFMFKSAICVAFSSKDSEETIDVDAFGLPSLRFLHMVESRKCK
jgi:hypothetical protein